MASTGRGTKTHMVDTFASNRRKRSLVTDELPPESDYFLRVRSVHSLYYELLYIYVELLAVRAQSSDPVSLLSTASPLLEPSKVTVIIIDLKSCPRSQLIYTAIR